jgi:hypothetical protein
MMVNGEIEKWLDSEAKNYQEGLSLLLKYGKNMSMKHFLTRKENRTKLEYELRKFLNIKVREKKTPPTLLPPTLLPLKDERVIITEDGKIRIEDLPEVLQGYYRKNAESYKLMRALHEKMKQTNDRLRRAGLRKEIVEYDDAIIERWAVIDRYVATGELPEVKPEPVPAQETLTPQTVNALRTAISRKLEALEKATVPDRKKAVVIDQIQLAVMKLIGGGQSLSPKVIDRLRVFGVVLGVEDETLENPGSISEAPKGIDEIPDDA